jgi:hypothetical protein
VTTDPGPFLSTIVAASATLAAIIGGLLVARFVSLDSDQRGSRKVVTDARARLEAARDRSESATLDVVKHDAEAFFRDDGVLREIESGTTDADVLVRGRLWEHSMASLQSYVSEVAEEFARARKAFSGRGIAPESTWREFRRLTPELPEIRWPAVWERLHDRFADLAGQAARTQQWESGKYGLNSLLPSILPSSQTRQLAAATRSAEGRATNVRRRDDLLARRERAAQQAEDCEGELRRLEQDHREIVRPDSRLWWGVCIVVVFAVVGVALPLWEMSRGNVSLASVRWVFWLFAAALAALIIYIVAYLALLTRRKATADNG